MKVTKQLALFLILILGISGYSQNSLKKGYYIDNNDKKVSCLINDLDWLNNPTAFKFKLSENDQLKTISIEYVKEFGISNISKYRRFNVKIDRSSSSINEMGYDKKPIFKKEQLFLKVLIEGEANLYSYEDRGLRRYFFDQGLSETKQLIFKNYLTDNGQVAKNNEFRRQLWNTLKCESISMDQLAKINYRQSELIKFFITYNKCSNSEFINYNNKTKKDIFNLTFRPGFRSSSLRIANQNSRRDFNLGTSITNFRLGLEGEFILGFNNNKWAVLIEPTYKRLETENIFDSKFTTGEEFFVNVNQTSIDVNIGIRYYIRTNKKLNIFTNIVGTFNQSFDSSITITSSIEGKSIEELEIRTGGSTAIGIGCKHKAGYSLELRYIPIYDILNGLGAWGSEFSSASLIFGYSFF